MEPQKIIYIQVMDVIEEPAQFVTWCNDRINSFDIEYVRKEIFNNVCSFIAEQCSSCPADMLLGWENPGGCALVCKNQAAECWSMYFLEQKR